MMGYILAAFIFFTGFITGGIFAIWGIYMGHILVQKKKPDNWIAKGLMEGKY
jgi:hypothetical protein